ncbi:MULTISPECIES: hypothetical protein [unclassified Bradyrhizobium]|uniref:hypothetical protein n=1 Tax=unclassified Bradyrhizobium TaxID=2631580 RepID=UPI001FF9E239|nr:MULTISPECIES: hypothetical protein [unclassified Bradyrhizobium]MCK1502961.1 hypothetical protein [Bradyrhizobium sp. 188]UPJ29273.1 hypothetical protein IVB54_09720 [Bradyrhizobium sp. CW1]
MRSHGNEILRGAVALLKAEGATNISHRLGGKHIKLTANYRGSPIRTTLAVTPSDWRAGRNTMAVLKRQLRAAEAANSMNGPN